MLLVMTVMSSLLVNRRWLEPLVFFILIIVFLNTLSATETKPNRVWLEEIAASVNDVMDTLKRTDFTSINRKLTTLESKVFVAQTKIDQLLGMADLFKSNGFLLEQKILKLEEKLGTIENQLITKTSDTMDKKFSSLESKFNRWEEENDGKLRKLMNIITTVYELNKNMKLSFDNINGRSIKRSNEDDDDNPQVSLAEVQRKIQEQISVNGVHVKDQMSSLSSIATDIRKQVDTISSQLLEIQDDFKNPSSSKRKDTSLDPYDANEKLIPIFDGRTQPSSFQSCSAFNYTPNFIKLETEFDYKVNNIINSIETSVKNLEVKINDLKSKEIQPQFKPIFTDPNLDVRHPTPWLVPIQANRVENTTREFRTTKKSIRVAKSSERNDQCTSASHILVPKHCAELRDGGANCDGVYIIMISFKAARAYCDMRDDGGGWTVIMRRGDFSLSNKTPKTFNNNWSSYKQGFGDPYDEFWMGNEYIHTLTNNEHHMLRVELESFNGDFIILDYDSFKLTSETDGYKLIIGSANVHEHFRAVAEALIFHNETKFSTYDQNNSRNRKNCAVDNHGGWWFSYIKCYYAFLNGQYFRKDEGSRWDGIQWPSWKKDEHLKAVQMKIRPKK